VILLLVQVTQIKFVVANQCIFVETLVHQFDYNFGLLQLFSFKVLWLEEDVFVPNCNASVIYVILGTSKLTHAQAIDLDDWVNGVLLVDFEIFCLLNKNMNHIIAAFHLTHI